MLFQCEIHKKYDRKNLNQDSFTVFVKYPKNQRHKQNRELQVLCIKSLLHRQNCNEDFNHHGILVKVKLTMKQKHFSELKFLYSKESVIFLIQ